jgi:hypothetical protein
VQRLRQLAKRLVRAILWPARRFFDPRFAGMGEAINQVIVANDETSAVLGRGVSDVEALAEETHRMLREEVLPALEELRREIAQLRAAERAATPQ